MKKEVVGIILGIILFSAISSFLPQMIETPYEHGQKELFSQENYGNPDLLDDRVFLSERLKLNLVPRYLTWGMVQAVCLGLIFAFLPSVYYLFNTLNMGRERWKYLGLSLIAISLIFGISGYFQQQTMTGPVEIMTKYQVLIGDNSVWFNAVITILYLIPAGVTLAVNFVLIQRSLTDGYLKENLDYIKQTYNKLLRYTTVILVLGILVTDLLRQAIIEVVGAQNAYLFPKEFVIGYSLVFSFFILIFYGPLGYKVLTAANKEYAEKHQEENPSSTKSKSFLARWDPRFVEITLSTLAPIITAILLEVIA